MTRAGGTTIAIVIAMASRLDWRVGFDDEAHRLARALLGSSGVEFTVPGLVPTVF